MSIAVVHGRSYTSETELISAAANLSRLNRQIGESDGRVTELNAITDALETLRERRAPRTPVFYVYYRTITGAKGYKEFKSARAQEAFISRTPHAITAYN